VETEQLIETLLRRTMVEIARLATAGGARLPLARLQDRAFLELTRELARQGVKGEQLLLSLELGGVEPEGQIGVTRQCG
jgi:hypothetical protein